MNEKMKAQIAAMKEQTIGVEVEMNSITRRSAAKVAAEFFDTGRCEDTAYRNGYRTWSAWDTQGREWKFQRDSSIYGPDDEKCEMVTPILTYADMDTLQELVRRLRKAGAKSDATRGCGVHIHIGAKGHTPQSLRNLANIMASHESLLVDALSIDRSRINDYCAMVSPRFIREINDRKPSTMSDLADIWYTANYASSGRNEHYNDSRYHMLNLHATFTKGTIEFRLFQFDAPADGKQNGLHAGQLKSYIQLCLALSQMAKSVKTASPDYELLFKGSKTGSYLTIEPKAGASVPVAAWEVNEADELALDHYEGFPGFYYKAEMVLPIKGIRTGKVRRRRVFVYIMHEERSLGLPSAHYVAVCRAGYDFFGFGQRYLTDAIQRSMEGMK